LDKGSALDRDGREIRIHVTNNPYLALVEGFARLLSEGEGLSSAKLISANRPSTAAEKPAVMIFSPHPDDEIITGALPLRLLRELRLKVVNVAVTLGSRTDRQAQRLQELKNACNYVGFDLLVAGGKGLGGINPVAREQNPQQWSAAVEVIAGILHAHGPSTTLCRTHATGIRLISARTDWCSRH
jgi:hypothetical protein